MAKGNSDLLEFLRCSDAPPFSMTVKSLKMKEKQKSHFLFLRALTIQDELFRASLDILRPVTDQREFGYWYRITKSEGLSQSGIRNFSRRPPWQ